MSLRAHRLIAFLFHAPGLKLFAKRSMPEGAGRENVIAGAVTIAAMVAASLAAPAAYLWHAVVGTRLQCRSTAHPSTLENRSTGPLVTRPHHPRSNRRR